MVGILCSVGLLILLVSNFVHVLMQFNPASYSVPNVGRSVPSCKQFNSFFSVNVRMLVYAV